ncbi:MAG TPA: hypothetical protein VMJ49_02235 [Gaiellaceae bacterium]|nr:hypothetical protein [Gaiellaceae bacterium]
MRVAVVSSPRSGNMWLRRLLVAAYGLEERSAHTPDELDWETLPERCALQLHWRRTPEFRKRLRRHGFSVAVLARHPLDVLVSILHFAPHEPQTARWLDGEGGSEEPLLGADPASPAFLAYATGPRAKALLSVTPEWWPHADARARYEDLVADPPGELGRIVEALGGEPAVSPAAAVEAASFGRLRDEAANMHFWQGRPGLWNELVPTRYALEIAAAHPAMLDLGYTVGVDAPTARARWTAIAEAS